jgi:copper chaperone CopZ
MIKRTVQALVLGVAVCVAVSMQAGAETPIEPRADFTTIKVTDMHCMTCAKKIAAHLYAVPGVVRVHADLEMNLAYVVPQRDKNPSPKAIWEAVEKAGFQPVAMQGPSGTFAQRPNR